MTFERLVLVSPEGRRWRWRGWKMHSTVDGRLVRLERWEGTCRACLAPFEVLQKLPAGLIRRYEAKASRTGPGEDVVIPLPRHRRVYNLATANCMAHRGERAPSPQYVGDLI